MSQVEEAFFKENIWKESASVVQEEKGICVSPGVSLSLQGVSPAAQSGLHPRRRESCELWVACVVCGEACK